MSITFLVSAESGCFHFLGGSGLPAITHWLPGGGGSGSFCPGKPLLLQEDLATGTWNSSPLLLPVAVLGKQPQVCGAILTTGKESLVNIKKPPVPGGLKEAGFSACFKLNRTNESSSSVSRIAGQAVKSNLLTIHLAPYPPGPIINGAQAYMVPIIPPIARFGCTW